MPEFESDKPVPNGFERSEINWEAVVKMVELGVLNQAEDQVARYIKSRFRSEVSYTMIHEVQPTWVTDRTIWVRGSMKTEDLECMIPSLVDDLVGETNGTLDRMSKILDLAVHCAMTDALRIRFGHTDEGWSVSVKVRYTYISELKLP